MRGFGKDVGLGFGRAMHNQSYHGMNLNASNSNNVENRKDSNVVKRRHQRGKRGSPKNQKQSSGRRKAKKAKAQHDEYGIPMVEDSDGVVADQPVEGWVGVGATKSVESVDSSHAAPVTNRRWGEWSSDSDQSSDSDGSLASSRRGLQRR